MIKQYPTDESLERLRQSLQKHSKDPITAEDARNLLQFFELLIETDKKVGIIKDESQSSG